VLQPELELLAVVGDPLDPIGVGRRDDGDVGVDEREVFLGIVGGECRVPGFDDSKDLFFHLRLVSFLCRCGHKGHQECYGKTRLHASTSARESSRRKQGTLEDSCQRPRGWNPLSRKSVQAPEPRRLDLPDA
jgi:hypothetical protein